MTSPSRARRRDHRQQRVVPQDLVLDLAEVGPFVQQVDDEVHLLGAQGVVELGHVLAQKRQAHARVALVEVEEHLREVRALVALHVAHPQLALWPVVRGPRANERVLDVREDGARLVKKDRARSREPNVPAVPLQQRDAHLALERAHLLAERRLGDEEPLRRTRERELLRHGHKVLELPEVHGSSR